MRAWSVLMNACGVLAALVVGAIATAVSYDVIGRNVGLPSLPWIVEVTEMALPLATLLAAPWLLHRNQHVRLDILDAHLSSRWRAALDRVVGLVGLVVCAVIVWYAVAVIRDNISIGAMVMKSLVFPEWWLYVPVPLSFGLMALEFARRLVMPATTSARTEA
jgi:TRAP-type C4-dicarboxylate transport system permease small subunit